MVLVSYIPDKYTSILQTKFSYGEGHEARRIGLEAMPLDQHIEGRHGESESCLERRPDPVHDLLAVRNQRQHREHRFHQHAVLPLAALTQFEVGGIAFSRMEGGITQDNPCALHTVESATERCCPRHWRSHSPTPRSTPTGSAPNRVCPRQFSDGLRALCGQSVEDSGL